MSVLCRDFIDGCLEKNPKKRMTAKQAQSHPWITKAVKEMDGSPLSKDSMVALLKFQEKNLFEKCVGWGGEGGRGDGYPSLRALVFDPLVTSSSRVHSWNLPAVRTILEPTCSCFILIGYTHCIYFAVGSRTIMGVSVLSHVVSILT